MKTSQALPRLTAARAPLTREVEVIDERGERDQISIPAERDLTIDICARDHQLPLVLEIAQLEQQILREGGTHGDEALGTGG